MSYWKLACQQSLVVIKIWKKTKQKRNKKKRKRKWEKCNNLCYLQVYFVVVWFPLAPPIASLCACALIFVDQHNEAWVSHLVEVFIQVQIKLATINMIHHISVRWRSFMWCSSCCSFWFLIGDSLLLCYFGSQALT